jgi:D-beta-D-heptose 7-phosphate kinase/D-beta-D-heptose 1-phosphate adenosyltransferase
MTALPNQRLISAIESWSGTHILCVGDVMLDRFIYGNAGRISPEAPIPVLLIDHEETMLGGAGNVVRNLAALGAHVSFTAVAGNDADCATVESLLKTLPQCTAHIVRDPHRRTSAKTRYLAHSQQLLRVDAESTAAVSDEVLSNLLRAFTAALPDADLVILSDYAKGVLSGTHASKFIEAARAAGKPVFVDPKGTDFARYKGATLIKPNQKELAEATRMDVHDDSAVELAARSLIASANVKAILATRGAAGMTLVREGAPAETFRSLAREIYDLSGAGDTVAATLALGAASGLDLADAVRIACIAAGSVVGKVGTATVTTGELLRELMDVRHAPVDIRILGPADALQRARIWKNMGLTVGYSEGAFHPLGPDEVAALRGAKEKCDKLVVCLTNDNRSGEILASLACVDLVVACAKSDTESLLEKLRPDFIARSH